MALMWGWGPFAIKPEGQEIAVGERVRAAMRGHAQAAAEATAGDNGEKLASAVAALAQAEEELWRLIGNRIRAREEFPQGADTRRLTPERAIREQLVVEVFKATLLASLLNIEYEFKSAEIGPSKFPTKAEGPAHRWVQGAAVETNTHRSMPGMGASEDFNATDPHAVEAPFLVAAARAYVDAINAIAPFRRGTN